MRPDNDQVFRKPIEISEEEAELTISKNRDSLEDVLYMNKTVTACELTETVVSNYNEPTYNVVKDICVDDCLPMMQEKEFVKASANPLESKSAEDDKFEELVDIQDSSKLNQDNLIVTREEVKVHSEVNHEVSCKKSPSSDVVVATSESVTKEALTLGDIISMEEPKNNRPGKTEESKANNLRDHDRNFETPKKQEHENERLNYVLECSYDHHHLFSSKFANGFEERSFSEGEPGLAHITYSGPISVSGSLSVGSDGSTVSAHSFAFPVLQSEWNSSPVRMAKPETRQLRKKKGWRHYSHLLCCRF